METIKARVHDATIDKVAQFFDAGSTTVLHELFQNARRSGATRVEITEPDESAITITDDGHGIPNPQSVLDFGRSEWNGLDHENPAGMGFFALARYRIAIRSQPAGEPTTWYAEIGPEHFAGKESAEVVRTPRNPETRDGTAITITHDPKQNFYAGGAALHFPLPVLRNGELLPRRPFLAHAVARRTFEGVEIGVFRNAKRLFQNLNFHGVTAEGPTITLGTEPDADGNGSVWNVAYDVSGNPDLELVLPARNSIVHNEFSRRLTRAAELFLYEAILALKPNSVLSYREWEKASVSGFKFQIPQAKLEEWRPAVHARTRLVGKTASPATREIGPDAVVFQADDLEAADAIPLWHALQASRITNVFRSNRQWTGYGPDWTGYGWYDAIPKITSVRILVENDGITTDLMKVRKSAFENDEARLLEGNSRVDAITFEMTTTGPRGETGTIRILGEVAFSQTPDETDGELPFVLLRKGSGMSSETLEEMIVDTFFEATDDCEADSWETQLERFRGEARALAISNVESPAEARKDSLLCDLEHVLRLRLTEGERIVIDRTAKGLEIDFQPVEAAGALPASA